MNELQETFGARGLSVVGVTHEGPKDTERYIKKNRVKHAYAYDEGGELSRWFGVTGIPHAVLVDPTGTVAWRGHPSQLSPAIIERALQGALDKPLWEWPENSRGVQKLLFEGRYAKALSDARALGMETLVQERIAAKVAGIEQAFERGDYYAARTRAEEAVKLLEGLPEHQRALDTIRKIDSDPARVKVLQGQKRLADLSVAVGSVSQVARAEKLVTELTALAGEFPDSPIAKRAVELRRGLEKRLQRTRPRR